MGHPESVQKTERHGLLSMVVRPLQVPDKLVTHRIPVLGAKCLPFLLFSCMFAKNEVKPGCELERVRRGGHILGHNVNHAVAHNGRPGQGVDEMRHVQEGFPSNHECVLCPSSKLLVLSLVLFAIMFARRGDH